MFDFFDVVLEVLCDVLVLCFVCLILWVSSDVDFVCFKLILVIVVRWWSGFEEVILLLLFNDCLRYIKVFS